MAACAEVDVAGRLVYSTAPASQCTGYIVLDPAEYPSLANIYNMPASADLGTAWMLGFSLPVIVYLVSWAFGHVIGFASKDRG